MDPEHALAKAISKPLFGSTDAAALTKSTSKAKVKSAGKLKADEISEKHKADLAAEIRDNTRARMDPFLQRQPPLKAPPWKALGVKRKREVLDDREHLEPPLDANDSQKYGQASTTSLVNYDSD
jgi:hypothetical protein